MATTATLSKDVIDLFKEKVALLTDQVTALQTENTNLKKKVFELEKQAGQLQPKTDDLDEIGTSILKVLFERGEDTALEYVAAAVGISTGRVLYYRDVLKKAGFIGECGVMVMGDSLGPVTILPKGREYIVQKGLA